MRAIEGLKKAIAYQAAVVSHFAGLGNQLDPPIPGAAIESLHVRFLHAGNNAWNRSAANPNLDSARTLLI
jgi:hypothetical protein